MQRQMIFKLSFMAGQIIGQAIIILRQRQIQLQHLLRAKGFFGETQRFYDDRAYLCNRHYRYCRHFSSLNDENE